MQKKTKFECCCCTHGFKNTLHHQLFQFLNNYKTKTLKKIIIFPANILLFFCFFSLFFVLNEPTRDGVVCPYVCFTYKTYQTTFCMGSYTSAKERYRSI